MSILASKENNVGVYKITRPGKFGTTGYYARQYARLTSAYINLGYTVSSENYWKYKYDTTQCDQIIIRCEIPEGASGYILGFKASGTNKEFSIKIQNGTITYRIGNSNGDSATDRTTHAWEPGVHNIGFTSDMYAYFDGKIGSKLTPSSSYTAEGAAGYMLVGGWMNGSSAEAITSIDIYEVALSAYHNSTVNRSEAHYYAASSGNATTGTVIGVLYEARNSDIPNNRKYRSAAAVGSGSSVAGDLVTYGVQLHDLKKVTGSGYRDFLAIVCQDDPEPTHHASDADPKYTITGPDSDTFDSAFLLKKPTGNEQFSLPTGWSHESSSPSRPNTDGTLGALICGRVPLWHIWSDNINVGKYGKRTSTGQTPQDERYEFFYNITHPRGGNDVTDLRYFEGYTTAASANRPPKMDLGSAITIEYHNGIGYQCRDANRVDLYGEYNDGTQQASSYFLASKNDDQRVFLGVQSTIASDAKMALGNLIDWFKTGAQQYSDTDRVNWSKIYMFYGLSGTIQRNYGNGATRIVAAAWEQTTQMGTASTGGTNKLMPLSSDTPNTSPGYELEKFRDGKKNGVWYQWGGEHGMSICGTERDQDQIFYEISQDSDNTIEGEGKLDLIINGTPITAQSIPSGSLCDTTSIIPATKVDITGDMNPHTNDCTADVTTYRCILMNADGKTKISGNDRYVYPLFAGQDKSSGISGGQNWYGCATRVQDNDSTQGYPVFQLAICCLNGAISGSATAVSLAGGMHLTAEFSTVTGTGSEQTMTKTLVEKDFTIGASSSKLVGGTSNTYYTKNKNGSYVQIIDDTNKATALATLNFVASDLPSAHTKTYNDTYETTGSVKRLVRETTVRIWVDSADNIIPKVKIHNAPYDWVDGEFKITTFNTTAHQECWIDKSDLFSLRYLTDPVTLQLRCYNNNTNIFENFTVSQLSSASDKGDSSSSLKYGIVVEVYRTWDVSGGAPSGEKICGFIIFKAASSDTSAQSGWKAYGLNKDEWECPFGQNNDYHLDIYGSYAPRITITDLSTATGAGWGSNNLLVVLKRSSGYDFYD